MTKKRKLEILNYLLLQLKRVKDGDASYMCWILDGYHCLCMRPWDALREVGVTQKWIDSGKGFIASRIFYAPIGNYCYNSFNRDVKIDIVKELIEELKQISDEPSNRLLRN